MIIDDFDFHLPATAIAQRPSEPRDRARLLHVGNTFNDYHITDLSRLLRAGDLLVFNDTKVIPARLLGRRDTVAVEILLHHHVNAGRWRALARPAKRLKPGNIIAFEEGLIATLVEKQPDGDVIVDFGLDHDALLIMLDSVGQMPLPPYIHRPHGADERDRSDYQTLFATHPGAIAAPTAGLHFTQAVLEALAVAGIDRTFVTLHVGLGTFQPVRETNIEHHVMHAEWGEISTLTAQAIARARAAGGRIVAVGTTALRLLEAAASEDGTVSPFRGDTTLFITPGYRFRVVNRLLTNFHLPRSTLFMLVSAFSGLERMKAAYVHALASGYRFYSYGDCCLLEPVEGL